MTTGDISYDMIQAGRKVRVLNSPMNIDYEGSETRTLETVEEARRRLASIKRRIERLEREGPPGSVRFPEPKLRVRISPDGTIENAGDAY